MVDVFSKRYSLLNVLSTKLLGFEFIKDLYVGDSDFYDVFDSYEHDVLDSFYRHDEFLFKIDKFCMPRCSMRDLLMLESLCGVLMRYFGISMTLDMLNEHFYWLNMKKHVYRICNACIAF